MPKLPKSGKVMSLSRKSSLERTKHFDEKTYQIFMQDSEHRKSCDKQLKKLSRPSIRQNTIKVRNLLDRYQAIKKIEDEKKEQEQLNTKYEQEKCDW